jgi:RNA polymerase sigma-70 factor (ECF subfamily)
LLNRLCEGDDSAFATLVERHSERFYRVAYRFTGNRAEAEDITQEAFLKLWERPSLWRADRKASFTTWFYRVVINLCLDHKKKKRPVPLLDDRWVPDERQTHEETLLQDEKQLRLEKEIAALPDRQRVALNLCFYEELSNQQAADIMGIRLKALQSLLMRAKTTLKSQLMEKPYVPS